jgi:hypothetical protein
VDDRPLPKPEHLHRTRWLAEHGAAVATFALGALTFVIVAISQHPFWATPDWRLSVPGFAITAAASVVSIARRERAWALWLLGLGLAAASLVLGWFLMLAVVIGVTGLLILVFHSLM